MQQEISGLETHLRPRFEEGIDVQVRVYNPANRSDADRERLFEESRSDAEALEKRVQDSRTFVPVSDYLALLASFEPSYVMVWYGCDDLLSWKGNEIYEANVKDGQQAKVVIEQIVRIAGPMAQVKQGIGVPTNLDRIALAYATQTTEGRRTLNFQFGSSNPMMLWREMFNVYVAEGFEQPAQEQPRSLYQRFVDLVRT